MAEFNPLTFKSFSPRAIHAELAQALETPGQNRYEAINGAMERFQLLEKRYGVKQPGALKRRADAVALPLSIKGTLLRADLSMGTTAFADYGRHIDTMAKRGLVESGTDFQGSPVNFLTEEGFAQAATLQQFASDLHYGMPYAENIPYPAPTMKESEQQALWGDKALQGKVDGQAIFSNGHLALLVPEDPKLLPLNQRGDVKNIMTVDVSKVWPTTRSDASNPREPIVPVAVSGTMIAESRKYTDERQVWFSNGQTADAKYVDAIHRQYPNAQFSFDPTKARRGPITVSLPSDDGTKEGKVVGVLMGTARGYLNVPLPDGVATAMDAHHLANGINPRIAQIHRVMQEKVREFNTGHPTVKTQKDGQLVLRGVWSEVPYAHFDAHWDVLDNRALHQVAKHAPVLVFGKMEQPGMNADALTKRWVREAYVADTTPDGQNVRVLDSLGNTQAIESLDALTTYRRERALPEWFAEPVLHELRYTHEAKGSNAFTPGVEGLPPATIGQRVRWTGNTPGQGIVEGLVTQCEKGHTGNWRLNIRHGKSPTDGEPLNTRVWSNEGKVEEAGWHLDRPNQGDTFLVEPSGSRWMISSSDQLKSMTDGIGKRDAAMAFYADSLQTQWWKSRDLVEYQQVVEHTMQKTFGIGVDDSVSSEWLVQERNVGNHPQELANTIGAKYDLTPMSELGFATTSGLQSVDHTQDAGGPMVPVDSSYPAYVESAHSWNHP